MFGFVLVSGIHVIAFMFVSESDAQTWIFTRVVYDRVHVRIRVRVGSPFSVSFLLVINIFQLNQCKFYRPVRFLL